MLLAGLGLYEYMQLCEELKTEPIWVINNGVSHQEFLTTDQVLPWINDTLDSIEFITGSPDSTWGSVRASMGHPQPWGLRYVAIGNEVSCLSSAPYKKPRGAEGKRVWGKSSSCRHQKALLLECILMEWHASMPAASCSLQRLQWSILSCVQLMSYLQRRAMLPAS